MELTTLNSIGPIDGRYRGKTQDLAKYLSEYGLIKYRVLVEIEYFIDLASQELKGLASLNEDQIKSLRAIVDDFSEQDAQWIKDKEAITNHDVKAVEYFVKTKLDEIGLSDAREFVHFGLTSQDINNTAIPLSMKHADEAVITPEYKTVYNQILQLADAWDDIPLLARTHGQPATPTRLGKEMQVFATRLNTQLKALSETTWSAKFGGATGGMNAHVVAYPDVDWEFFAISYISRLGLNRSYPTTQIEHYDNMAAYFDALKRINTILIDFCRDIWTYISMDYFKQKINKNEVGSSAMPHKVNPIDFENAEGNLGISNTILEHLSAKLPISRLQRDLTDSTVLRNVGVPLGHILIALKSIEKGIGKLIVNKDKIASDLEANWAVVAEAVQTVLRRESYPEPYEALKALTRTHGPITKESLHTFIDTLEVSNDVKAELKNITPSNYTGL